MVGEPSGQFEVQYYGTRGWWTGHHGVDLPDPAKYIASVNKRPNTKARAIDRETGEIYGDGTKCSLCGLPHEGLDGSCLI